MIGLVKNRSHYGFAGLRAFPNEDWLKLSFKKGKMFGPAFHVVLGLSSPCLYFSFFFIKNKIRTYSLQEQFTNYLQIHFYMVLIITEVLLEACFSEVPKLFNQPIIRFY